MARLPPRRGARFPVSVDAGILWAASDFRNGVPGKMRAEAIRKRTRPPPVRSRAFAACAGFARSPEAIGRRAAWAARSPAIPAATAGNGMPPGWPARAQLPAFAARRLARVLLSSPSGFRRESTDPRFRSPARGDSDGATRAARSPQTSLGSLSRLPGAGFQLVSTGPGSEFLKNSIKSDKFTMFSDKYMKISDVLSV